MNLFIYAFILWLTWYLWPTENNSFRYFLRGVFEGKSEPLLILSTGLYLVAFLCFQNIKSACRFILLGLAAFTMAAGCLRYFWGAHWLVLVVVIVGFLLVTTFFFSLYKENAPKEYPEISECLGHTRMYDRLHARIRRTLYNKKGRAIAIYGDWGSGKTHCLRYLAHRLSLPQQKIGENKNCCDEHHYDDDFKETNAFMESAQVCSVNLWEHRTVQEAWDAIVRALTKTITKRVSLFDSVILNKYIPSIMKSIPGGETFARLYEIVFCSGEDYNELQCSKISEAIGEKHRVVLILDDVDRASYVVVRDLLPLIEKLKRIDRLMVVCAIAKDEFGETFIKGSHDKGKATEQVTGYLTKIFDYSFNIPNLVSEYGHKYALSLIKKNEEAEGIQINTSKEGDFNAGLKLLRAFLNRAPFWTIEFDTPRQVERVIDRLSSIERQYFTDSELIDYKHSSRPYYEEKEGNEKEHQEEHCVFLIEIFQMLFPEVLEEAHNIGRNLHDIAGIFLMIKDQQDHQKYTSSMRSDEEKKEEDFEKKYPRIWESCQKNKLVSTSLYRLSIFSEEEIERAIEREYEMRVHLTGNECRRIIEGHNSTTFNLKAELTNFFMGEEALPKNIQAAGLELFKYASSRVGNDRCADFLKILISEGRCENYYSEYQDQFVIWEPVEFFRLLKCVVRYEKITAKMEEIVLDMYNKAEYEEKMQRAFWIWNSLNKGENLIEYKYGRSIFAMDWPQDGRADHLLDALFRAYLNMIVAVFYDTANDDVTIRGDYGEWHVYDNPRVSIDDKEVIKKFESISLSYGIESLNFCILLQYMVMKMTLSEGNISHEYTAVSKLKANMFLPLLEKYISHYPGPRRVYERVYESISQYIKDCNDSIEFWRNYSDEKSRGQDYIGGAEAVKKFLEKLMQIVKRKS